MTQVKIMSRIDNITVIPGPPKTFYTFGVSG